MRLRSLLPAAASALLAVLCAAAPAAAAITIGPGPARGTDRAGVTWYEDFQDWTHADLRALDNASAADPRYDFFDGLDDSRDLVAFYHRAEGAHLYFRVDLYDLALGAETTGLDLYLAIDAAGGGQPFLPDFLDGQTDRPWELCLAVYRSGTNQGSDYQLWNSAFSTVGGAYLGAYFNSQLDAVEFGITRQSLIDAGWDGSSPLTFQVFTTRDGAETSCSGGGASSDLTDAFVDQDRGCSDGVLNGGISSTASAGLVYYASIAHGNQSVNQADDIGAHIYDPQSNTGIAGGTGFLRALDTHRIFRVPLNIHPSGTLAIACNWARRPGGASDPQDGPSFLQEIRAFVDADQADRPGSLIGGVLAEHIMPYFEGPVNAASIGMTDSLYQAVFGVSAADMKVMHTPERVIRSQSTGLSPLDGHTFEDIAASPYTATYLDEVTHLHHWFHPGESCSPDAGYRHKVHRINGVYCFMINDREDQGKFGNHDGGMVLDTRFSLLQKALYGGSSEIVVVFDDWEAMAGKSFDPGSGNPVPNNNPNQYHTTIRWAANKPWIRVSNLKDVLDEALANPSAFVIDHGTRHDLSIQTYEWLKHASEDSYHYWYYNENAGFTGNEQDFYDLVPVITGPQGDYRARGATPASDGPPLPSGMKHGDLNTPGTLMYETWAALTGAPPGRLRDLGIASYLTMIYETAWHEEDEVNYSDSNCYGAWLDPDDTWDGLNTWALRLQNHVRKAKMFAHAAAWADSVGRVLVPAEPVVRAGDLDLDGEAEYVVSNRRVWAAFERYGGRCVLAVAYDHARGDAEVLIGAPFTNPSAPGEEEYTGMPAHRCSGFKDMNGGTYADAPYAASPFFSGIMDDARAGITFTSPDGKIVKDFTLVPHSNWLAASYTETVSGPLYVRIGLSPNPMDLAFRGHANLSSSLSGGEYRLANAAGGLVVVNLGGTTFNPSPSWAGSDRRNLALTEEVELSGDGSFLVEVGLFPGTTVLGAPAGDRLPTEFAMRGPWPSPARGDATIELAVAEAGPVRLEVVDVSGRRVATRDLGWSLPRLLSATVPAIGDDGRRLEPGLYFVTVAAGDRRVTRRWVVLD